MTCNVSDPMIYILNVYPMITSNLGALLDQHDMQGTMSHSSAYWLHIIAGKTGFRVYLWLPSEVLKIFMHGTFLPTWNDAPFDAEEPVAVHGREHYNVFSPAYQEARQNCGPNKACFWRPAEVHGFGSSPANQI